MLVRPRLTDFHGIQLAQSQVDFAIPFLEEDIPLYVDPFLLWRSPSQQDQALHTALINAFNNLGVLVRSGKQSEAAEILHEVSECEEVGLGESVNRKGKKIGIKKALEILELFKRVPQYAVAGFRHIEEIQLYIDAISKDRISDIACSFLKSFLIDFTIDQCQKLSIPTQTLPIANVYDYRTNSLRQEVVAAVPYNPISGAPLLFVPKRWLRFTPWINFDDYYVDHCPQDDIAHAGEILDRVEVLNFNRENYAVIESYVKAKERQQADCHSDPLFTQIPVTTARSKMKLIKALPTGKAGNADKKYEDAASQLLASLLYPMLDFADVQSRTDSGVSIRDLIFYNTRSDEFLREIMTDYLSRQLVFEIKNVAQIERGHIDQLNRYLKDEFGKFGVFVTRHELKRPQFKSTIDLWSGQRRAIIAITDMDLEQMVEVFESRQRAPIDILKRKYVEFKRACP